MKAIIQTRYGSCEVLELRDVPQPTAGDGQVLVRVRATSVHADVWHVMTGRPYAMRLFGSGLFKPKNPIPGRGGHRRSGGHERERAYSRR